MSDEAQLHDGRPESWTQYRGEVHLDELRLDIEEGAQHAAANPPPPEPSLVIVHDEYEIE